MSQTGLSFTDADVVNPDDFIPAGEYNPHNIHPFVLHDHGFVIGVVFAEHLQDALDIAVDENRMDHFMVSDADMEDYGPDEDGIARLGNAGEPFDIQNVDCVELANPKFSFVALLTVTE